MNIIHLISNALEHQVQKSPERKSERELSDPHPLESGVQNPKTQKWSDQEDQPVDSGHLEVVERERTRAPAAPRERGRRVPDLVTKPAFPAEREGIRDPPVLREIPVQHGEQPRRAGTVHQAGAKRLFLL